MTDPTGARRVVGPVTKADYELVFQDTSLGDGTLRLVIERPAGAGAPLPREFVVDSFRAYRSVAR
ncbi:MAG TPA: hypothetical protein VOA19_03380 [Actinomycetes bacterium]|nr:hypothetical protein [Actinomycetes bacterium]